MKQWIAQAMPAEVISGCGPKAEAQIAAASVLHGVSVEGYGCSLDFTKCYDSLDPRGTVSLLQAAGLPDSWVNTLNMVWTQQSRWILWGGCVMPDKLQATEATPQGDPWGPLALQLWMAAGNGFVHENLTPDLRTGITRIFMDDRSFSEKTPEGLSEKRRLWSDWSHQVGLLEHPDKTQFVGSSQRHTNDLRDAGVDAALVTDQWEILGVTAALTRRRESAKEQSIGWMLLSVLSIFFPPSGLATLGFMTLLVPMASVSVFMVGSAESLLSVVRIGSGRPCVEARDPCTELRSICVVSWLGA